MINFKLLIACLLIPIFGQAQDYPEPEYANEVYQLQKDSPSVVIRLEKDHSKMDTKMKAGGFGGAESVYEMEGDKSTIRIHEGRNPTFVFSTGASVTSSSSAKQDSLRKAYGVDSDLADGPGMFDPVNMITLYKMEVASGNRKIVLQKGGGYFGSKMKSIEKYSFSIKKIREGYWELVIDKELPKGEYAFTFMDAYLGGMDGSVTLFAFGID